MTTEDIKKFIYNKYNEIDYNGGYNVPPAWTYTANDNVYTTPITWTTSGDRYYYEKYFSSQLNPMTIASVDLANDSKKESKNTTEQDSAKNDGAIIEFDWDKMFQNLV